MNLESCYKYKIVVLGDTSVGKTSIINKLIYDKYYEDGQPTIGIDFVSKQFLVDEKVIKFQLWDTAG
jgi:small GTP-binding protein